MKRKSLPFTYDIRRKNYEIVRQDYDKSLAIHIGILAAAILLFLELFGEIIKHFFEFNPVNIVMLKLIFLGFIAIVAKRNYLWIRDRLIFLSGVVWKKK